LHRALDGEPGDVLGHSRGGYIARQVARRYPALLRSLILADPAGDLDDSLQTGPRPVGIDSGMIRGCVAKLRERDVDGALQLFVDTVHGTGTWAGSPRKFKDGARDNAYTLLGQIHDRREPFSTAMLGAVDTPTLLLGGELSPQPFPAILDALEAHLPRARRVTVTGASHGMNLERPEAFNEAVRTFLETA
jgi:pimeloyl-ACP methyl ester carboxylesterase